VPTFDALDPGKLAAYLNGQLRDRTRRGIYSAAVLTHQEIVVRLIPGEKPPPVDRGAYRAGWRVEMTEEGADIVNKVPQAAIIELGVRAANVKPGKAMIDALAEWARRKGLLGKGVRRDDPQLRGVAWAIATAMRKGKGIFVRAGREGLRIAERGKEFFEKKAVEEVAKAISEGP